VRFKEVGTETAPDEVVEVEAKAETETVEPVVEEVAKEAAVAPEAPVVTTPAPVIPQVFEAVFGAETVKELTEGVAATTVAAVQQLFGESIVKTLQLFADALASMEKQITTQTETLTALNKHEDERVKEQVGLLPRATLKAITSAPVATRPSQRNLPAAAPDEAEKQSFAEIAKQTLYGDTNA
jgi:hypothetical protein